MPSSGSEEVRRRRKRTRVNYKIAETDDIYRGCEGDDDEHSGRVIGNGDGELKAAADQAAEPTSDMHKHVSRNDIIHHGSSTNITSCSAAGSR
jgi:hypothetical protein